MWYAIMAEDAPDSLANRIRTRPAHLVRIEALNAANRLLLAGPFPAIDSETPAEAGFTGSLIVAQFDNLEEATAWANADPFVTAGVYQKVQVKPFRKTLP